MNLDELLTSMRVARRLNQRQLAIRAGVDPGVISRIESGQHKPTPTNATKILQALHKQAPVSLEQTVHFCELANIPRGARALLERQAAADFDPEVDAKANLLSCYEVINAIVAERGVHRTMRLLLCLKDFIPE